MSFQVFNNSTTCVGYDHKSKTVSCVGSGYMWTWGMWCTCMLQWGHAYVKHWHSGLRLYTTLCNWFCMSWAWGCERLAQEIIGVWCWSYQALLLILLCLMAFLTCNVVSYMDDACCLLMCLFTIQFALRVLYLCW